jgi:adenylosuccinate lyase
MAEIMTRQKRIKRNDKWDLVSKLKPSERRDGKFAMTCISPDDGKYRKTSRALVPYLTQDAEWKTNAYVQRVLLETRVEFGCADRRHLRILDNALPKLNTQNMALLEEHPDIQHDQLAVLEEIGRFVPMKTKALLHPGTTSYDIVDTTRAYLFKRAWYEVMRPKIVQSIEQLCSLAERCNTEGMLQVGRTHLQNTSPLPFGLKLSRYAERLAKQVAKCDIAFNGLRGKISGIVGTGASVDMVIGEGKSLAFEEAALKKLGLEPDYASTQITSKESLVHVGCDIATLMTILGNLANDMRYLYSAAIGEVTSRDNAKRLGGSSADALKNNPIQWENIAGTVPIVQSGILSLYAMLDTNQERDLRNSRIGRYQPQAMMSQTYDAFTRFGKALTKLSVNIDKMTDNLIPVRRNPGEAMTAILRGAGWVHSEYGEGHSFVKEMGKVVQRTGKRLLCVCKRDAEFKQLYNQLPPNKRSILNGRLEKYLGSSAEKSQKNIATARKYMLRN